MYTIGIDLGGTNIAAGLCDSELNVIDKGSVPTLAKREPLLIVRDMAALAEELIKRNGLSLSDVEYVGIAAPGAVNPRTEMIETSANLPFTDFPIVKCFKDFLPVGRVIIANDANAAALGEALCGAAKGAGSSLMITLGTGVGGGVILDGKIFDGGLNSSGTEIGHTVIVAGGRPCGCGRRGCFEAYASATGLRNMAAEKMEKLKANGIPSLLFDEAEADGGISAKAVFAAAKRGDAEAQSVVDEYIFYLAEGVTNMVNIFQPEILSIGGGVCNAKDALMVPLREKVDRDQYTRNNPVKTKIVRAVLGNDAGIIGAAGLGK